MFKAADPTKVPVKLLPWPGAKMPENRLNREFYGMKYTGKNVEEIADWLRTLMTQRTSEGYRVAVEHGTCSLIVLDGSIFFGALLMDSWLIYDALGPDFFMVEGWKRHPDTVLPGELFRYDYLICGEAMPLRNRWGTEEGETPCTHTIGGFHSCVLAAGHEFGEREFFDRDKAWTTQMHVCVCGDTSKVVR